MSRVECRLEPVKDEEPEVEAEEEDHKYKIIPPKELESKFLAMMKQRELDKIKEEEEQRAELEKQRILVKSCLQLILVDSGNCYK